MENSVSHFDNDGDQSLKYFATIPQNGPASKNFSLGSDNIQFLKIGQIPAALNLKNVGTTTETQNAFYQPLLIFGNKHTLEDQEKQGWTRCSLFAARGRKLLFRRLLSSGPANLDEKPFDDDANGELNLAEKRAGWRRGTRGCCIAITLCIVVEIVLLIWATKTSIGGPGSGLLFEGDCDKIKKLSVWLLLPLNIAATILISTSNYMMQIMAAPNRSEIDQAHRSARSISVCGNFLQSINYRRGRMRRIIWWVLAVSSLPIHLLLNSAIYSSVQASNIGVLVVSNDFENDPTWNSCNASFMNSSPSSNFSCILMHAYKTGRTQELSRKQCILQYASGFSTNASSVIVVTESGQNPWYSPPHSVEVPPSYGTACNGTGDSQIPNSERFFSISYTQQQGNVSISLPFSTHCTNESWNNGTWLVKPGSTSPVYSTEALFYAANDTLTGITSIRAAFSAISYRYWATAELTGDYLSPGHIGLSKDWDTRSWLCPRGDLARGLQCNPAKLATQSSWEITPAAMPVSKCHVYTKNERCTLRYSWRILVITICCDVAKLIAMVLALRFVSKPLITLGDVIASFLEEPDPCTEGRGLLDADEAEKWTTCWQSKRFALEMHQDRLNATLPARPDYCLTWQKYDIPFGHSQPTQFDQDSRHWLQNGGTWWTTVEPVARPKYWVPSNKRWYTALSEVRRLVFIILYFLSIIAAFIYLTTGLEALQKKGLPSVWAIGLGGPDPNALWDEGPLSSTNNVTVAAVLVNLTQVIFSMLYFMFNAIFTTMHTAREWADFYKHRKALRVSSPRGQQRSTYWLQLPWAYSLPLIVVSGSLHWLLGRSIYLVKVEVYGHFGESQPDKDFFACGYTPITTLIFFVLLLLAGLALSLVASRKLGSGSPLVMLNSLAISAACHPDPSEKELELRPLMWGVLKDGQGVDTDHCSFSAKEVAPLKEGHFYH